MIVLVWCIGVEYELISLVYTIPHTNPCVLTTVHTLTKKVYFAGFCVHEIICHHQFVCHSNQTSKGSAHELRQAGGANKSIGGGGVTKPIFKGSEIFFLMPTPYLTKIYNWPPPFRFWTQSFPGHK